MVIEWLVQKQQNHDKRNNEKALTKNLIKCKNSILN